VLEAQMSDGGWNRGRPRGSTHSWFHTTINVLEGMHDYACVNGDRISTALAPRHLEDPIARTRDARANDGRWQQQTPMAGKTSRTMERVGHWV
jgi:hypothetical protein